jgi:hypothetical protein
MCDNCRPPTLPVERIATKVHPIGKQTLARDAADEFYVSIKNRTYRSWHWIPKDRAQFWMVGLSQRTRQAPHSKYG